MPSGDNQECLHGPAPSGYEWGMNSVLMYLLAVLLVPMAIMLMLFIMARVEGEAPTAPKG